jgi:hypothetical protein
VLETLGDAQEYVKRSSLGRIATNPAVDATVLEEQVANSRRDDVYTDARPDFTELTVEINAAPPALTTGARHQKITAWMGALPGNLVLIANRTAIPDV